MTVQELGLPPPKSRLRNAMTVDVEDWFQVQAFADAIPREEWDWLSCRVEANTEQVLERFAEAGVRGTFFTLGWVAQRYPALVRRIVAAGHELASHGHGHELVSRIGAEAFRADIRRARALLEDAGGVAVHGYRAPTFSIGPRTPWAHAILAEEGYHYSSSIFPVRHDLYGAPDAPRGPYRPHPDGVVELPMTTVRAFRRTLPCSGGGWFRLVPYALFRAGLQRVNAEEGRPGIFYFHPWEVDPDQPRVFQARALSRFRHYTGLASMGARLDRLLRDFAWGRMADVYAAEIVQPAQLAPLRAMAS
ncbi:XrtA system polysaccharide deacetylase [Falsiroseomonas sp. E2-1-a20]|uniref:XrtA system polysaccharide deacetylase n=1 Tax=Falsiroseomonas sp. E2-1-a20 TaxID=3239300 RepID=UPI003F32F7CA